MGAAFVWSFSSVLFTNAGRRVGALIVNRTRLVFAVLLVGTADWLLLGRPFPVGAEPFRFFWLSLSALVGLVVGDTLLFQCYVLVGRGLGSCCSRCRRFSGRCWHGSYWAKRSTWRRAAPSRSPWRE